MPKGGLPLHRIYQEEHRTTSRITEKSDSTKKNNLQAMSGSWAIDTKKPSTF